MSQIVPTTLRNVLLTLQSCARSSSRLNSVFNEIYIGPSSEFGAHEHTYPLLVVLTGKSLIEWGNYVINIDCMVVDKLDQDRTNFIDVQSDTLQMAGDLISEFRDQLTVYGFTLDEESISLDPVDEITTDYLSGWTFTLTIRYMADFDQTKSTLA